MTEADETVDWARLRTAARRAAAGAYAPYSGLRVGAAAITVDGRLVTGCNVENASYGLTLCAECGLVSALHATGGGRLSAFTCVSGEGDPMSPCGRCRQLLYEHGGADLRIDTPDGPMRMADLLPYAFGPMDGPPSARAQGLPG